MVVYVHRHVYVGVSLQVVIGLCKRKETAALKIKAAASYVRENMSALRRLFFFCRRPTNKLFIKESGNVKLDLYDPTTLKYFPPMPFLLLIG